MIFWVVAGAMTFIALTVVLVPLLRSRQSAQVDRREQNIAIYRHRLQELESDVAAGVLSSEEAAGAREELIQRLPHDLAEETPSGSFTTGKKRWIATVLVGVLPLLGVAMYVASGGMQRLSASRDTHKIDSITTQLTQRLNAHPDNPQGWFLLGRLRMSIGHYSEAAAAYAQAEAYSATPNARILSRQAQALGMAAGGDFRGTPSKLLARALEIDPSNTEALWLSGVAAQESDNPARALSYWQQIGQANLPKPFKALLNKRMKQVRQLMNGDS